ncbi:hypothetical protein NDU88_001948 [Pleurodeles waltl]|uniref:Uncharacterized protein n=1 Tax=Pleurodeles waltl TaxID=8319 RepID=A0AAV7W0Y5_PLEWA|nr:hypothetical protein NDU88_001948 [Pleurodeles waltl]
MGPLRRPTTTLFERFVAVRYQARPPPGPATPRKSPICSCRPPFTVEPLGGRVKGSIGREALPQAAVVCRRHRTGATTLQSRLRRTPGTSLALYGVWCGTPAMLGMNLG